MEELSGDDLRKLSLKDLVVLFFRKYFEHFDKRYYIAENVKLVGSDNRTKYKFDLVVVDETMNEKIGVWIKDWRKAIGIDVYRRFKKAIESVPDLSLGFLFANKVSRVVRNVEKKNIFVLHRGELISILRSFGIFKRIGGESIRNIIKDFIE